MRPLAWNVLPVPAALLLLAAACGPAEEPDAPPAAPAAASIDAATTGEAFPVPDAPTAWRGQLPCADCEGILTTVRLAPDGHAQLEEIYQGLSAERAAGGDTVSATRGRWTLDAGGSRIRIDGGPDGPRFYRAGDGGGLRALDRSGGEIASGLNYDLDRLGSPPDMGGTLREQGNFSYMADAALFVPCASGIQTPVAMEGAYLELERAYLERGAAPGSTMRVSLTGSIEARPAMEGDGTEPVFVVREWSEGAAGAPCAAAATADAVAGAEWRLVELEGESLPGAPEEGGPYDTPSLSWDREEARIAGSGGCNRFTGRGVLRGTELVGQEAMASTMRFCEGVMELEDRYLRILSIGGHLRLDDGALRLFQGPREVARYERGG